MGRLIVFVPVALAYYYVNPGSMFQAYKNQDPDIAVIRNYVGRVFDQFATRRQQPLNTLHRRYHPDVGYL
jgi:hypothetical protein